MLQVEQAAIDRLKKCRMYPIIVKIRFKSVKQLKDVNEHVCGEKISSKEAKQLIEKVSDKKIDKKFSRKKNFFSVFLKLKIFFNSLHFTDNLSLLSLIIISYHSGSKNRKRFGRSSDIGGSESQQRQFHADSRSITGISLSLIRK